jgi:RNA polymerase sigma-70 factor (ECF subfamily)
MMIRMTNANLDDANLEDSAKPAGDDRFGSTRWSVVLAAGGEGTIARSALELLCRTYWLPAYEFVRRRTKNREDADDLTQAFFADLLDRKFATRADPLRGRFRAYLLTALKNFLANQHAAATAQKRGGQRAMASLEADVADHRHGKIGALTPEQEFERRWALALLNRVMSRLATEQAAGGRAAQFEALRLFLTGQQAETQQKDVAGQLGVSEEAVRSAIYRLRKRYRALLRDEIAQTVRSADEIDDELRQLFAAVSIS